MNLYSLAIHASSFGVGVTAAIIEQTVTTMGAIAARSDRIFKMSMAHLSQLLALSALQC